MKILITGGTGTLGRELLRQLYKDHELYVISRDELKQQNLKKDYPKVGFTIGCIRDSNAMRHAICRISPDIIFHAAALKHVDVVEENVKEGMLTNVLGVMNVHEAALEAGCKIMVLSSTDKAVLPINAYGYTKGLAEKYLFSMSDHRLTNIVCRYGNIIGSRGSVIHSFAKTLKEEGRIYITDMRMTRFFLPIEKAVAYMIKMSFEAFSGRLSKDDLSKVLIPEMKAMPVIELARLVAEVVGVTDYNVIQSGIRPGEKIHELLFSSHEICVSSDKSTQCDKAEIKQYIEGILND